MKSGSRQKRGGWLFVEAMIGIGIMVLIAGMVVGGTLRYTRAREESRWRQVGLEAAEAQMTRIRCGAALDSLPPPGWVSPKIRFEVSAAPGEGDWEGLSLVEVRAVAEVSNLQEYEEAVRGYVALDGEGGGP